MNNLKCIILLLFSVLGLFANAEDETITFTPSVDKSTKTSHNTSKAEPDMMTKDGITISSSDAFFNVENPSVYKIYDDASLTISADTKLKKIVLDRYTQSGNEFEAYTKMNKDIPGNLKVEKIKLLGLLNLQQLTLLLLVSHMME